MHTLALDPETWDLTLDGGGNPAVSLNAQAIAQNVSNAVRLFTKDAWFDQTRGLPHLQLELGRLPPEPVLRDYITQAALNVEGVAQAQVRFTKFEARTLEGVIYLTTHDNQTAQAAL